MVEQLQRLLTTLMRQLLDNIYRFNVNKKFINETSLLEDGSTADALLNPISEFVPVVGDPREAMFPEQIVPIAAEILPVVQHAQTTVPIRTGVAPENNVDPDVLQQTTAGAFMGAMEKASERLEMIARLMAETGFKQLFRKVHYLTRTYPDIKTTVKLRGEWVHIDPKDWHERTDVTINVGLGFHNKEHRAQLLQGLLAIQEKVMPLGLSDAKTIYSALAKAVDAMDLGAPEQFFLNPNNPGWQPPQPTPNPQAELFKAQAQALTMEQQRKAQELQVNAQIEMAKTQLQGQKIQADMEKVQIEGRAKMEEIGIRKEDGVRRGRELDLQARKNQIDTEAKIEEIQTKREEGAMRQRELDIQERKNRIDTEAKIEEIQAKREEGAMRMRELDLEEKKTGADVQNTEADSILKYAQAAKTKKEAGKVDVEAGKVTAEIDKVTAETGATMAKARATLNPPTPPLDPNKKFDAAVQNQLEDKKEAAAERIEDKKEFSAERIEDKKMESEERREDKRLAAAEKRASEKREAKKETEKNKANKEAEVKDEDYGY